MDTTVSVVIPVYNGENFISQAVQSALDQSAPPLEIIVVNDGSTDATLEKLMEFGSRIRIINIQNGGVSNARNVGLRLSKGSHIAFLDADDVWHDTNLEVQKAYLQQYPEVGFCCCDFSTFAAEVGHPIHHFSRFKHNLNYVFDRPLVTDVLEMLLEANFVGTCSNVIVSRKVLDRAGLFNPRFRQAEDYDLWLRCADITNFLLCSAVLVQKRSHQTNLTNDFLDTLLYHEDVLCRLREERRSTLQGSRFPHSATALAKVRYDIGNMLFEKGHVLNAFHYFVSGGVTCTTFSNLGLFLYHCSRKLGRLVLPTSILRSKRESLPKIHV